MYTCEICDAPLRSTASNEFVKHGITKYHVCSYTCETVLRDRATSRGIERRP